MMSAIGYGLVLLGLASAVFGAAVGIYTGLTRREGALPWVQRAVYGFSLAMIGSNVMMIIALLTHDFSVKYVAQVGSRSTPTLYTIVSLWSALEGSILFWGAIMGAYLLVFALVYRREHGRYMQLTLGMMLAVGSFFAFLIAGPANPWTNIPNPLPDGPGPNALLQNDVLMIIHPPMLYLGFVGMTVPFGIAAGALLRGELGDSWLVPLRKWTIVPWFFLSVGIILGSWWAYKVLGWGGYWAWDPVENASFMPWLTATAFIHSTMVLERKKSLKLWTLSLALGSFVLTIVGTFMTRSGVFNSVHSFTQSSIGPTFLVFIAILFVFSIVALAWRGPLLVAETNMNHVVSREGSILVNNLLFVAITFTVFLGTIFPLVNEGLFHRKITVGEPYFNTMALPGALLMLFLMGVGPVLPWGASDGKAVTRQLLIPTVAGLVTAIGVFIWRYSLAKGSLGEFIVDQHADGWMALAALAGCSFVMVVTLRELALPARTRMAEQKESALTAFVRSASRSRRRTGGYIVHIGILGIIGAVATSASYKSHTTATLKKGETLKVGDYQIRFDGLSSGREPHREWVAANITILYPDGTTRERHDLQAPRMNYYASSTDPIGSPAVQEGVWRDVYASLLAYDPKVGTASFNTWVFPLVGWIWYVIPILLLGSLIAMWPERNRRVMVPAASAPTAAEGGLKPQAP